MHDEGDEKGKHGKRTMAECWGHEMNRQSVGGKAGKSTAKLKRLLNNFQAFDDKIQATTTQCVRGWDVEELKFYWINLISSAGSPVFGPLCVEKYVENM